MILAYDPSIVRSFIVLATVITIVNYDRKTFIVQTTGLDVYDASLSQKNFQLIPKLVCGRFNKIFDVRHTYIPGNDVIKLFFYSLP
jgi:hypothetical protein